MIKSILQYQLKAVNAHGIHSPFVFEFYNEVLVKSKKAAYPAIENLRKQLKKNQELITIEDHGAGSRIHSSKERSVSELVKVASIDKKHGQLLAQIIQHYNIQKVIEFGTSMGIGSAYLAQHAKELVTVEGDEATYLKAKDHLQQLELTNVQLKRQLFDDFIAEQAEVKDVGLVYIDGNHSYEATMNYFEYFSDQLNNEAFLVFDDIRWSEGMQKAWQEITASKKINVSIELMRMGIVVKRKEQEKQHFVLRF